MGKTIEELFRSKQLQSSGKTAEKTYDIRNSKDINISSNSPLMGLPFKAMNGIRKTIGFRTKETLLEEEFGGLRPLRLISSPILYGTDIIRLTTRKTNDVQAMKDSINNNGTQGGNNGLIGRALKKVEGFVTKKLGLPQDTYPTYVINTGKLQKGKEPDTMITIGEIKKDAAGTSFGRFLKQTGGGTPSQLAKQIIGGGLKVTQGAIRTALFGSQTVASLSKGNHNGFVGKYASTANYESSMSTYTQTLALNYLDISAVSPIKGFTRKGEVYGRDLGTKSYGMRLNGRMGEPTSAFLQDNRYWIGDKYTSSDPNNRTKGLPNRESSDINVSSKFLNPKFLGNTFLLNSPAKGINPDVEKTGRFGKSEYAFELSYTSKRIKFGEITPSGVPKIYTSINPYSPYGGKSGISTVLDPRVETVVTLGSKMLRTQAWLLNSPAGGIDPRALKDGRFGESIFAFSLSDNTNHKKFGEPTINGLAKIYTSSNPYSPYNGVRGISTALNPRTNADPKLGGKMLLEQVWELNSPTTGLKRKFGVFGSNEEFAFKLSDGDFHKKKGEPTADELEKRNTFLRPYFTEASPLVPSKILKNPILGFIQPKKRTQKDRFSLRTRINNSAETTSNVTDSLSTRRGLKTLSDVINQTGVFTVSELASIKYNGKTIDEVDLIPLRFTNMGSGETIYFRAIVSGFNETFSPSWENSKMIGSPFNFYNYTGIERKVTFNLKAYAMSSIELAMMWRKIEFLANFNYPGGYTDGGIVLPNLAKFTFGDLYHNRVCFLDSLSYSIEDSENLWELGDGQMKYGVSDYYDNDYEFNGKFRANPGGEVISNSGQAFSTIARRREGIKEGENRIYDPNTKKGFLIDNAGDTARVGYNDVNYSMKSFRLPKFLNASIGVTFIESRSTTTRLYDFGTPLSNDVRPAVTKDTTSDGNKQNNAAKGSGGTGGTASGGTQGPVPVKNVEKKIKGTNVPDGTKQVQFGGGSFGGGGAGGSF
jgi:uncharacterized membrane protein YgcG